LISTNRITTNGEEVSITHDGVSVKRNGIKLWETKTKNGFGLWTVSNAFSVLAEESEEKDSNELILRGKKISDSELWHNRMGHVPVKELIKLKEVVKGMEKANLKHLDNCICSGCEMGKAHRAPFNGSTFQPALKPGDRIHADSSGPLVASLGGNKTLSLLVDESSRHSDGDLVAKKSQIAGCVMNQLNQYEII
jgi:hypothetical protein